MGKFDVDEAVRRVAGHLEGGTCRECDRLRAELRAAVLAGREDMAEKMIEMAGSTFAAGHRPKVPYEGDCVGNVISIERLREIVSDIADRINKASGSAV